MEIQAFSSLQTTFKLTLFAEKTTWRTLPLPDVSHGPSPPICSSATTQSINTDR